MKTLIVSILAAVVVLSANVVAQKQLPPEGGKPKDFKLPEKQQFTLPNGMEVTLIPFGSVPKVTVSVVVRSGNINEKENQVWLADITGEMMKEGTTTKTSIQVAQDAAGMGGNIDISVGPDLTTLSGDVLAEFGPQFVKLLADVARNPLLPESELARIKNDRIRELSVSKSQPQSLALEEFRHLMYPHHAYGMVFPAQAMLEQYTIDDVRSFYRNNFGAQRT